MEMLIINFKHDIVAPITIEILSCIYMLQSGVLICIRLFWSLITSARQFY